MEQLSARRRPRAELQRRNEFLLIFTLFRDCINATSLGMKGQPAPGWPIQVAKPHAIICDAVYAPLETELLRAARGRGLAALDGLGMLIHQGALAFEIWFGIKPDAAAARRRLMAILESR
jgi:shikimate dehydrogenase